MQGFTGFDQMFNVEETRCYFDIPVSTLDFRGVSTVKLRTTALRKASVHSCFDGLRTKAVKLPPMIIFKNLKKVPKGKYPVGVVVEGIKWGETFDSMHTVVYNKDH